MLSLNANLIIDELIEEWHKCGINKGDTLLLHSDIKHLLMHYNYYNQPKTSSKKKVLSVENVLDSFLYALGESGTLIVPLFNFDFTQNISFDVRNTQSQMGILSEAARNRKNYIRTLNPVYSFAIFGKNKQYFKSIKLSTALGKDSVFSRLLEINGKIAALGLPDKQCMTFYHHIEEIHKVPYRICKKFIAPYTGFNGVTKQQTISLYVRDLDNGINTLLDPVAELMWKNKLYKGKRYNEGIGLRTISAKKMYTFTSNLIHQNKTEGFLYEIKQ